MNIRVQYILGRPGTGKTTLCHSEIAEKQRNGADNSLILIVPEQFSFQSEKALIAATGNCGLWRAQVLSFHRLSYYVFGKTSGIDKKILEDSGKHMLLRKILSEHKKQLVYFRSGQDKRGFIDALSSSITEFYQYSIEPQDLLAKAETMSVTNLHLKLMDLHLIYSAYKNYLEAEYISSDEILDVLAEKIHLADFLKGAEIWIDGFKSFTPQEKKVLASLISVAKSVKIVLCVDKGDFGAFYEARDTMRQVNQMVAEVDKPIFLDKPKRYPNAPDIAFLCSNFLRFDVKRHEGIPENIHIFSAENVFDEIHNAAKIVTMLSRDRGYRYCDIGVVAADLAQYEKYIPAIFSQYDIPVFVDARREIFGHPLAEIIFAALEVVTTNWQYEAVFRMLRCAMSPIPQAEVDLLENYVLAYNIRGKIWKDGFTFGPDDDLEMLNAIRAKVVQLMTPLANVGTSKVSIVAKSLYHFLIDNALDTTLARWIEETATKGDNEALRGHEQIWGKVIDALDKMVEILGESRETIGDFAKILEAGMTDLGLAPPSIDQLVVGDLRRSRFGEIKALIVLGANEGIMPGRPESSGLLDDGDRGALVKSGMNLAKDHIAKIYEEEFLIYSNFSKPQEYLAISYHNGDLEGGAAIPTRLIARLAEMFPGIAINDSVEQISAPRVVFGDMVKAMGEPKPLAAIYLDAYSFFNSRPEHNARLKNIEAALAFYTQSQVLSKKSVQGLYGRHLRTSVSRLQRFINCSFSYFVEYNLAAKPRKYYEAGAVDMGNIYHDILAQFGTALQNIADISDSKLESLVDAAVEQALSGESAQILNSSGKYRHYANRMRQISRVSAMMLAHHLKDGDFTLAFNETVLDTIQIPFDDSVMHLDGRIDRVDLAEINNTEYVKIIDYKSGRRQFSLSEVFHGLDMQLLVYLSAFIQKLSEIQNPQLAKKIMPAAALYFNLLNPVVAFKSNFQHNPDAIKDELKKSFRMSGIVLKDEDVISAIGKDCLSTTAMDSEEFFSLMAHVLQTAQNAGREILQGNIAAAPAKHRDKYPCQYCDFRSICKFDATLRHKYRHMQYLKNDEVIRHLQQSNKTK